MPVKAADQMQNLRDSRPKTDRIFRLSILGGGIGLLIGIGVEAWYGPGKYWEIYPAFWTLVGVLVGLLTGIILHIRRR